MPTFKVPQQDGDITIQEYPFDAKAWQIQGGTVNVEDADVELFLAHVPGAELQASQDFSAQAQPAPKE